MRNRFGLLYGVLVALLLTIGIWWVYFLTHEGRVYTEYRLQKLATDRLHASFLIQADQQIAGDPQQFLGETFPHLVYRRTPDGWDVEIEPAALARIRAESATTRNMFLYEGLVFLLLLAAGSTILMLSVRSERRFKQARELFLAGATHELKTPLASLRLYAETLGREGLKDQDRARIHRSMVKDVGRLETLVDEVLSMSADDTFDQGPRQRLDLLDECAAVLEDLRRFAGETGVTLDLTGARGATVFGNRTIFALALRNLVINAVRHCPPPVRIGVTVEPGKRWHRVTVRDDGPGIPRRLHDRIFECFFSATGGGARTQGAGLGLYLVKRNVDNLGGSVELDSEEGRGSAFTMVLPAMTTVG
ncbi:MAG: HAMP domain-containing histidine kinase [Krumholzibacteria bacterium]|nr:HAMP domain-containing histidine kinase [Candidatus Krumholzibacteria bacterium]